MRASPRKRKELGLARARGSRTTSPRRAYHGPSAGRRSHVGLTGVRNVRARQDTAVGNAHPGRPVSPRGKVQQKANRRWPARPAQARVKGCGKSAPPAWRHAGHGKPRCVLAQAVSRVVRPIGTGRVLGASQASAEALLTASATARAEKWLPTAPGPSLGSRNQRPDRTRRITCAKPNAGLRETGGPRPFWGPRKLAGCQHSPRSPTRWRLSG